MKYRYSFLLIASGLFACTDNVLMKEYYPNGNLKSEIKMENKKKNGQCIYYNMEGKIDSILNFHDDIKEGQQLFFYPNGILEQIMMFKNNKADGMAYYFYKSGSKRSQRLYRDDKESYYGADFWNDTLGVAKSLIEFGNDGKIISQKNFDSHGDYINTLIQTDTGVITTH